MVTPAAAAWGTLQGVSGLLDGAAGKLLRVAAPTAAGVAVYFVLAALLRLPELRLMWNKLRERGAD